MEVDVDFAAVFAALPGIDLLLAPDAPRYTMLAATDARLAATMTTREGTLGKPLFDVFPDANPENADPTGVGNLRSSLDHVLRTGTPHRMARQRYDLQRADGTWEERYCEPLNVPVLGRDGAVRHIIHRVEDATTQVRAERETARLGVALGAERERLRLLVLHMPVPLALHVGPEHRHALVNDAYRRLAGGRDVLGLTPQEAFPELAGQGVYERFDEVYATGVAWVGPETHLRYDRRGTGESEDAWISLRYEPLRDPGADGPTGAAGAVTAILVLAVDVTEQVRARQAVESALAERTVVAAHATTDLARSEARFRAVQDASPDGSVLMRPDRDPSGRITDFTFVYANLAALDLLGLARDALVGRTLTALYPASSASGYLAGYARAFETGVPFVVDGEDHGRFGRAVHLAMTAVRAGDLVHARFVDVSAEVVARAERERLLGRVQTALGEAEQANRAKGDFLAVMSHELRTPLNAIGGYAELMELGIHGPLTDAQRTALARIQQSQRHLLGLINGVLNYARVEAGALHYEIADVPLAEVLAACEALIAPQVKAKRLTLAHGGCAATLRVRADREKTQQVVLNLVSNAVKFTEPGGRVTLDCVAEADRVRVRVHDTGIGIAPDQLARVFEPFVQVDATLTRTQDGTGLGLAISRDLARGMGGELGVESELGVGSVFTLTLPTA